MGDPYLQARLAALRKVQNADGGWGYFPGKQSWLEPTVYAALALDGEPASERAWNLLKTWQMANGGWRPSAGVSLENWGTSLVLALAAARRDFGEPFRRGLVWLLGAEGVEANLMARTFAKVGLYKPERNLALKGWPWKPNCASWVEPTAHALVALKLAAARSSYSGISKLQERIRSGEAQLFDVRCSDGGWNYGSRAAIGVDLPSYPETTALALVGLQGNPRATDAVELTTRMARQTVSPLARAWLSIALRLHGADAPLLSGEPVNDVVLTALEALSCSNYKFFKAGGDT